MGPSHNLFKTPTIVQITMERVHMISVCMIVKNEEKWIGEAIQNFRGIADQIVVVDTGSDDKTKEIAAREGAEVFDFQWNKNFADARNFSLEKATGDWIFCLDADERIAPESFEAIRSMTKNPYTQGIRFSIRNYCNDASISGFQPRPGEYVTYEQGYLGYFVSRRIKLFKNFAGIKFDGCVHELVEAHITGLVADAIIPIHHYGHGEFEIQRKSKESLYLESLQSKVTEKDNDWTAYFQLGVAKMRSHLYAEAADDFQKALSFKKTAMIFSHLGVCLSKLNRKAEAEALYEEGLSIFETDLDLLHNYAVLKVEQNEWVQAADLYQKIMNLYPKSFLGYRGFGYTLLNLNRVDQARPVLQRCLELFPDYEDAKIDMAIVCLSEGKKIEAAELAESVLQQNPSSQRGIGLLRTIEQIP